MVDRTRWNDDLAADPQSNGQWLDLGGLLWRRKWLILLFGLMGCGLGYLYYLQQTPLYESVAQVQIITENRIKIPVPGVVDQGYVRDENLATQMILIQSPLVVSEAVRTHDLGSLKSLSATGNPAGAVMRGLSVTEPDMGKSTILNLSFRGTDPDDCAVVLNAVMEAYQKYLADTQKSHTDDDVKLISEAKDILLIQLEEKEQAYQKFRQEAPLIWHGGEGMNAHQARLAEIEATRSQILIARAQTRAQLQALEAAQQRGDSREALLLLVDKFAGEANRVQAQANTLAGQMFPLLLERELLLVRLGPDHPKLKALDKQIELTRAHIQDSAAADEESRGKPVDFLQVYLDSLRQEIAASEQKERELDQLFAVEREAAKRLAGFEVQNEAFRNDIARKTQLFESIVKRLDHLSLVKNAETTKMQVVAPASRSFVPVEPKFGMVISAAVALGLLLGLALGYLVELADKSFRSPEEIIQELGMPVVGHIPVIDARAPQNGAAKSKLDAIMCTHYRPKSRTAEAYRTIRTALYFSTRGGNQKVIQVTSPDQGDGKSTLAANLAVSIANSGKRVLLVDADFRRPRVHKLLGLDRKLGISSVMNGQAELADAIQSTDVENLWGLPCGQRPSNPSELLTQPRFEELLGVLREKYDFLIIDTPPLLAVTDPSVVAARVDGVLLALRLTKKARQSATRATEVLAGVGANVLGVVVNGVRGRNGYGYAYGSYHYRYDHGGPGYSYSYAGNGGYYSEDEAAERKPRTENRIDSA